MTISLIHGDNKMLISLLVLIHLQHDWQFLFLGFKKKVIATYVIKSDNRQKAKRVNMRIDATA